MQLTSRCNSKGKGKGKGKSGVVEKVDKIFYNVNNKMEVILQITEPHDKEEVSVSVVLESDHKKSIALRNIVHKMNADETKFSFNISKISKRSGGNVLVCVMFREQCFHSTVFMVKTKKTTNRTEKMIMQKMKDLLHKCKKYDCRVCPGTKGMHATTCKLMLMLLRKRKNNDVLLVKNEKCEEILHTRPLTLLRDEKNDDVRDSPCPPPWFNEMERYVGVLEEQNERRRERFLNHGYEYYYGDDEERYKYGNGETYEKRNHNYQDLDEDVYIEEDIYLLRKYHGVDVTKILEQKSKVEPTQVTQLKNQIAIAYKEHEPTMIKHEAPCLDDSCRRALFDDAP